MAEVSGGHTWVRVTVACPPEAADAVTALLLSMSPNGVTTEGVGPVSRVAGYLGPFDTPPDPAETDRRVRDLLAAIPEELAPRPIPVEIEPLPDSDWIEVFRAQHKPVRVGRIVIKPTWEPWPGPSLAARADDILIELDPGLAFGTGLHPTTRACLHELQDRARRGMRVVDFGCGSGILTIAAAKFGAREVLGIDFDPMAVKVAEENLARNDVSDRATVKLGDSLAGVDGSWDLVVANISPPIVVREAAHALAALRPGGSYVCTGVPLSREGEVLESLRAVGFDGIVPRAFEEWVAFVCTAPREGGPEA